MSCPALVTVVPARAVADPDARRLSSPRVVDAAIDRPVLAHVSRARISAVGQTEGRAKAASAGGRAVIGDCCDVLAACCLLMDADRWQRPGRVWRLKDAVKHAAAG